MRVTLCLPNGTVGRSGCGSDLGWAAEETAAAAAMPAGKADATDPIERVSSRPDFQVLVYPGAAAADNFVVPKDAPPAFLAGTTEDAPHALSAAKLYLAFLDAKIPAELHIYNTGAHGFALEIKDLPVSSWNDRLEDWLKDMKILKKN